ncbi:hypothetical protein K437DRAFT_294804 [Tilletiaria anomala UBC 951]|uniref:SH3 domain-containing protein n=1 Tax=Tilletiaria anomala (strain ATCC 24038 / CBS 436.72 / UBC 951) TaxID=1037660 RepID=A0A066VSU8_TILAU|nr:uncharacterized protein K437DRAFT_294804 [Tilletiaria anomala UBC 951]KDN44546.1 hypothetical protein K437DRAFT_294804 [Tilletiaria anomala UBC 951]
MAPPATLPCLAVARLKYKSPHKQDLTFAKGEKIRVQSTAPKTEDNQDEDEEEEEDEWFIGESLDGSRKGIFPGGLVNFLEGEQEEQVAAVVAAIPTASQNQTDSSGKAESDPPASTEGVPASVDPSNDEQSVSVAAAAAGDNKVQAIPATQEPATSLSQESSAPANFASVRETSEGQHVTSQDVETNINLTPATPAPAPVQSSNPKPTPAPAVAATNKPTVPLKIGNSLRDRIAAFNKPLDSANNNGSQVPLPRPAGGGGWKRPPPPPAGEKPLLPMPGQLGVNKPTQMLAGIRQMAAAAAPARPGLGARTESEEKSPEISAAVTACSPTEAAITEVANAGASGGFSAADAKTSIKMSLKERMAALQRGQLGSAGSAPDGSAAAADTAAGAGAGGSDADATLGLRTKSPPPPLAPKPGKLSAERRTAAMAGIGMGVGFGGAAVAAGTEPEDITRQKSRDSITSASARSYGLDEPAATMNVVATPSTTTMGVLRDEPLQVDDVAAIESASSQTHVQDGGSVVAAADGDASPESAQVPERTPEEEEAARRAAIAQRMARLGGKRLGGGPATGAGPALFGAPMPPRSKQTSLSPTRPTFIEGTTLEGGVTEEADGVAGNSTADAPAIGEAADNLTSAATATVAPQQQQQSTLAVPRRAAPPRRKKSAPKEPELELGANAASPASTADVRGNADTGDAIPDPAAVDSAAAAETQSDASASVTNDVVDSTLEGPREATSEATALTSAPDHESDTMDGLGLQRRGSGIEDASSTDGGAGTSITPVSDVNIQEYTRQLEEFVKGDESAVDEAVLPEAEQVHEAATAEHGAAPEDEAEGAGEVHETVSGPERRVSVLSSVGRAASVRSITSAAGGEGPAPPTSRPGSVRPPVPRTFASPPPLSGATATAGDASAVTTPAVGRSILRASTASPPPPRRAVPTPVPPKSPSPAIPGVTPRFGLSEEEREAAAATETEEVPMPQSIDAALAGPALAAPKPRMALPAEDEAFEDDEAPDTQSAAAAAVPVEPEAAELHQPEAAEAAAQLTEEEEEAQRRARIAQKMARLGGQKIGGALPMGIMGAPMPLRRAVPAPEGVVDTGSGEAGAPGDHADLATPPPKPPTRNVPAGGIAIPGLVASQVQTQTAAEDFSTVGEHVPVAETPEMIPRDAAASPVRLAKRQSTLASKDVEHLELASVDPAVAILSPISPNPLPGTLPKPPSRSAPVPSVLAAAAPLPHETLQHAEPEADANAELETQPELLQETRTSAMPTGEAPAQGAGIGFRSNSRDLDLMPSSHWWRLGTSPLRLPMTVSGRPDAIMFADTATATKRGRTKHTAEVHVLFEDYSQTIIDLSFEEDDADEANTTLTQRHLFPPAKPTRELLEHFAVKAGAALASAAIAIGGGKNAKAVGDGSPQAFLQAVLQAAPQTLPPVGTSYGVPILVQAGPMVTESGADDIKVGDFVVCYGADLSGRKGFAPYHLQIGSPNDPTAAIVVEYDEKKRKVRCILQRRAPEEVSIRLDDLKAGIIKVGRPIPREGWIEDWA